MNIQVKINIMSNLPEFLTGFCADEYGGIRKFCCGTGSILIQEGNGFRSSPCLGQNRQ
jgi:hypothetical protein